MLPVLILCLFLQVCAEMDLNDITEERLNYNLFEKYKYNNLIRPVINTSDSLQINFSLALSAIINVDEKNQVIKTNVWLQMNWHDYQLLWEPQDYRNVTQIKVSYTKVWLPDIVLFNNADGKFEPSYNPNCVLQSNGNLQFIPPAIYTSSCSIDVKYFPFDQQECEMKFGSWSFEGKTLVYHMVKSKLELADYMKNGAWDIIDCPGNITVIRDSITGESKEIIVFKLVIRRKTLFYTVNLIIPSFLHALACLCVFLLPADGKAKVTLVISVLVSLVVFLLLLQKILPPSMTIPLIAKYFIFTFIMNVLEIIITIFIIYAHHKTPQTAVMPKWMRWLFLYKLPKYIFMERPNHDDRWQEKNCTPPPSYPNTPQVSRANIFLRHLPPEGKHKKHKQSNLPSTSTDSREHDRVMAWREKFSKSHSHGQSGLSSSASGSHLSSDESPTQETREFLPPNFPPNGHRCMLRESTSQSEESLAGRETNRAVLYTSSSNPLVLTKEIYSVSNAIKFICRQMKNKDDYNTVIDDWKYVAAVLDRLLMIIFVLVSLCGTLGVLTNAPHILETVNQDQILDKIKQITTAEES